MPDDLTFRDAVADLPAGVTIVTTYDDSGTPHGATVSAVNSLSLAPQLILTCLAVTSDTCRALDVGSGFLVHILAEGQEDLAARFAGKGADKFREVEWAPGMLGQPQLPGAAVVLACQVVDLHPGGDHVIVIGEVHRIEHERSRVPLVFHRRRMLSPAPLLAAS